MNANVPPARKVNEFDRIVGKITPALTHTKLGELGEAEVFALSHATRISAKDLALLDESHRLGRTLGVDAHVLYALGRGGLRVAADDHLAGTRAERKNAVLRAVARGIVPERVKAGLEAALDKLDRWAWDNDHLRAVDGRTTRVTGRVVDRGGAPAGDLTVRVYAPRFEQTTPRIIGATTTDARGLFSLTFVTPRAEKSALSVELQVTDDGRVLAKSVLDVDRDDDDRVEITVDLSPKSEPDDGTELALLGTSAGDNAALSRAGYTGIASIASTSRAAFVSALGPAIGDYEAARVHTSARAASSFMQVKIAEIAIAKARNPGAISDEIKRRVPELGRQRCGCEDCEAAVSPLAYLADLIDYAVDHLRDGNASITLAWIASRFHQPFAKLPASCDEMNHEVRQVRLCIEVLRRHLASQNLPTGSALTALRAAEAKYRLATYESLLVRLGTSYAELRLARTAPPEERRLLADRIGIPLGGSPDTLDQLLLSPDTMTEEDIERLFGLVDTRRDPLADGPTAKIEGYRLLQNRILWRRQDWPADRYREAAEEPFTEADLLPIVDPDIVSVDDLREPVPGKAVFDLWRTRREWIDARLAASLVEVNAEIDVAASFAALAAPIAYGSASRTVWSGTTPDGFDALLRSLDGEGAEAAATVVAQDLRLGTDAFRRLMALAQKDASARTRQTEAVKPEEWDELRSILVAAQKAAFVADWRAEEMSLGIVFGPRDFWPAERSSRAGAWPPPGVVNLTAPWIDPEIVKRDDLPCPTAGARALELLAMRTLQMSAIRAALLATNEAQGFDAMLREALGDPSPGDPLPVDLQALKDALGGVDADAAEIAKATIRAQLFLEAEDFDRLFAIRTKALDPNPAKQAAPEEIEEAAGLLASASKRKREYPAWIAEERDAVTGVPYWFALRAALPAWRGPFEIRRAWQDALARRSARSLIDPDLLHPSDFRFPVVAQPSFGLWAARGTALALVTFAVQTAPRTLASFDSLFLSNVGVPAAELAIVTEREDAGEDIAARLAQLGLSPSAFELVRRIRKLLAAGELVTDEEWADLGGIFAAVQKSRRTATWQAEERAAGAIVTPELFVVPEPPPLVFPPPEPPPLKAWRASANDRRDYEDLLASRIQQDESTKAGVAAAVSATEEATLTMLRDALLLACNFSGATIEQKAKKATATLFIDAQGGACQTTTRIAQAIETLQGLVMSVRTGQTKAVYPNLVLEPDDAFDEEWRWIGSYATWRSAMFVFLYPENVLAPGLKKFQTPAFRKLVSDVRANRRLGPLEACSAAREYAAYFEDICHLSVEASCETTTHITVGDCRDAHSEAYRCLHYSFAKSTVSQVVYGSVYDPGGPSGYSQSFWEAIPGMTDVLRVVGATAYEISSSERHLYLFCVRRVGASHRLVFSRYDLEEQRWDSEPSELEAPEDASDFSVALLQTYSESSPPRLAIHAPSGAIYTRSLSPDGTGWDDSEWNPCVSRLVARSFQAVVGYVSFGDGEELLLTRMPSGSTWYRVFGPNDDAKWVMWSFREFAGAFRLEGTSDVVGFFRDGPTCYVSRLSLGTIADESDTLTHIAEFDAWLHSRTGVTLRELAAPSGTPFAGRTFYDLLDLEHSDEFYPFLWPSIGEVILKFAKISALEWLDGQIAQTNSYVDESSKTSDDFGSWKLANEEVKKLLGSSIKDQLTALIGLYFDVSYDDDGNVIAYSWSGTYCYASRRSGGGATYETMEPTHVKRVVAPSGAGGKNKRYVDYQGTDSHPGVFRTRLEARSQSDFAFTGTRRMAPLVSGPFDITERISSHDLQTRRGAIKALFLENEGGPRSNLTYLEEAYYFVPVQLAQQLQGQGHHLAALDWYRTVYDYSQPTSLQRKIYYGLRKEEYYGAAGAYDRSENWLLDPLNPHLIAEGRGLTYTHFTVLAIASCFLEYADAEFTRDTAESVPRARTLYTTALELLESHDLVKPAGCPDVLGELTIEIGDGYWGGVLAGIQKSAAKLSDRAAVTRLVAEANAILAGGDPVEQRVAAARKLVEDAVAAEPPRRTIEEAIAHDKALASRVRAAVAEAPEVRSAVRRMTSVVSADLGRNVALVTGQPLSVLAKKETPVAWLRTKSRFATELEEVSGGPDATVRTRATSDLARRRYDALAPSRSGRLAEIAKLGPAAAIDSVTTLKPTFVPAPKLDFCIPQNPIIDALRLRASVNLYKIRTCRNISGMERHLQPYAAPTDTVTGMPFIGAGGQIVLPGAMPLRPTPYRYATLLDRAKQLVALAQQVENAMLTALEKRDAEAYSVLKARQDVRLAHEGVRLQDLRVSEAEAGVDLAELQQERAQLQADHFAELLEQPISTLEMASLQLLGVVSQLQIAAATVSFVGAGLPSSTGMTGVSYSPQGSMAAVSAGLSSLAASVGTAASVISMLADYQRRAEEWEYQKSLALQDVKIGAQQVKVAQAHVRVVGQERVIAQLTADNAQAIVDYLANKFTNVELYDWMSGVLSDVYGFFLQQATATAQLAAAQLAFERQELPPPVIQADYWDTPGDGGLALSMSPEGNVDRRGLTGSARLLRDIAALDQYAFETNRRKLQLSKTISLVQLAPLELQTLRETGKMIFATPMELFDREFPGHYLRLIRRVRVTMIALVPPTQGIRATLSTTALSRVVIGGDLFQTVIVNQGPQSVALSSPRDASGVFELDPQGELVLPFEGMGVDAIWELDLPRAANPFDFRTLADVLVTIEYTALTSADYREQVIARLRPTMTADRAFGFRTELPDAWYDLMNPETSATPMSVEFDLRRADFPPNLDNVVVQQVSLHFARKEGKSFEVNVTGLSLTEEGSAGPLGGAAATIDGSASTAKGNAGSWMAIVGRSPAGKWKLSLPNTASMKKRFTDGDITDIFLVITYAGRTPEWPN